jgi:hypothetical protein
VSYFTALIPFLIFKGMCDTETCTLEMALNAPLEMGEKPHKMYRNRHFNRNKDVSRYFGEMQK